MSITKEFFGKKPCGCEVYAYTMKNANGMSAKILNMGGIVASLKVPDKAGNIADVVCGFDTVEDYLNGGGYQGALIGRIGNRIGKAEFTLDGVKYELYKNDGNNHLHGGKDGFNVKIWDVLPYEIEGNSYLELSYNSPDGEENYPGNLGVKVTYVLTADNALYIEYTAACDKKTIVNLTNHAYFNLGGYDSGDVLNHTLWLDADKVSDVDDELIPTGDSLCVCETPFDFRTPKTLGKDINEDNVLLKRGGGYDHNFILNADGTIKHIGTLTDTASGRAMKVYTDQPCIQIYSANMIDESACAFKGGVAQKKRCAVCMETQHMPDSINHPGFTDVTLTPGQIYRTTTIYKFYNI